MYQFFKRQAANYNCTPTMMSAFLISAALSFGGALTITLDQTINQENANLMVDIIAIGVAITGIVGMCLSGCLLHSSDINEDLHSQERMSLMFS